MLVDKVSRALFATRAHQMCNFCVFGFSEREVLLAPPIVKVGPNALGLGAFGHDTDAAAVEPG